MYCTSGGDNGSEGTLCELSHFFVFGQDQGCTNSPTPNSNFPYGPDNQCTGPSTPGGFAVISTLHNPYIQSMQFDHVLFDDTGFGECYNTGGDKSTGGMTFGSSIINSNGSGIMTVARPQQQNPLSTQGAGTSLSVAGYGFPWPGMTIYDRLGNQPSFVTTYFEPTQTTGTFNVYASMATGASQSSGQITFTSTQNLEVGQPVFNDSDASIVGYIQSGCPGACTALNTNLSGTTFQLVTANCASACNVTGNIPAANSAYRSFNDTGNGVGGAQIGVGTLNIHNTSEPTITFGSPNSEWGLSMHADSVTASNNQVWNGIGTSTGTTVNFSDFSSPTVNTANGSCN
jgi:hypothetical protein